MAYPNTGILLSNVRKELLIYANNMDKNHRHYAIRKKLNKKYILYDSISMKL